MAAGDAEAGGGRVARKLGGIGGKLVDATVNPTTGEAIATYDAWDAVRIEAAVVGAGGCARARPSQVTAVRGRIGYPRVGPGRAWRGAGRVAHPAPPWLREAGQGVMIGDSAILRAGRFSVFGADLDLTLLDTRRATAAALCEVNARCGERVDVDAFVAGLGPPAPATPAPPHAEESVLRPMSPRTSPTSPCFWADVRKPICAAHG
ncbi:hypothetical protein [Streptomyces griseoruber]|nr:hypothetical protein [Streptomyces griseoruber]